MFEVLNEQVLNRSVYKAKREQTATLEEAVR